MELRVHRNNLIINKQFFILDETPESIDNHNTENNVPDAIDSTPQNKRKKMWHDLDWEALEVPWSKFDSQTFSNLENELAGLDRKKATSVVTRAIHYVVDHVREISDHAPALAFRSLAKKMCAKYEKVFADKLSDGNRQGTCYATLEKKLIERNRYLNRSHMTASLQSILKLPLKDSKKYKCIKAGCIDWQPNFPEFSR